ncbi:unnamed protein product [Triticum turgidum subsp. durum]|uniref:SAM-dependent MTase RsmB/NOP-type domain-containing protein n=1 Tax=Triticum turgidum subsp. durum TaxID=4567 RepID=A0A9R1A6H8_TRITD|nr:unnamed protein product [Triticum turgidum subsp. durum]
MDSSSASPAGAAAAAAAPAAGAAAATDRYTFRPGLRWQPEVEEYFASAYGRDHFARISQALAHPSCYSCIRVNTLKSSTDTVMQKLLKLVNENELSCGFNGLKIGEQNGGEQAHEGSYLVHKCPYSGLENVLFVRGSGPHALHYNDQPGHSMKEIIVSRKCAESVLRGAQVYVPGVLACSAHVEKGDKVAVSVAIEQPVKNSGWAVGITRGIVLQGLQSDAHYEERKGLYIGQGIAAMSRAGIFRVLHGVAVEMTERTCLKGRYFFKICQVLWLLMSLVMGILKLADEMGLSCIRAYKLDALKSVRKACEERNLGVADNCSEAIVTLAENSGPIRSIIGARVTDAAEDSSTAIVEQTDAKSYVSKADLRKNLRRMRNGTGRSNCSGGRVEDSKGFFPSSFDRVLLDAPCSALGLRPRLFAGEETLESLRKNATYQRRLFDQAVKLVRPGGIIVYSTCTINPGENEALVRYALDTYKFLSLGSQHPKVGGPGIIGSCKLPNKAYTEQWLTEDEAQLVQRFDPSSSLDTMGFFIAKFNVGQKED